MNIFQPFTFRYFCVMRQLQQLLDFYIFSNIHVALATFCLTKITLLAFGIQSNDIAWFVFFSTVLSYNYIRLYRGSEIKTNWFVEWITSYKKILVVISLISLVGIIFYGFKLNTNTLFALIPFGFATLFYVMPFGKGKSLRAIAKFKLFLIGFCWAGVTVLLPVIENDIALTKDIIIIFLQRFLFVLAITVPFDIRDLNFDSKFLMTLPQMFGVDKVKRMGLLFLMFFLGLNFLKSNFNIQELRVELIIALVSLLFLVRAKEDQHKYYSALFVEAIPIIWFLLIIVK